MKQYLYQVKGILEPASMEALLDALREIPMVDNATLEQEETLFLTLTCPAALSEQDRGDVETLVDAVLQKYQLQLELPALSKTYVTAPAPKQGEALAFKFKGRRNNCICKARYGHYRTCTCVLCQFVVKLKARKQGT